MDSSLQAEVISWQKKPCGISWNKVWVVVYKFNSNFSPCFPPSFTRSLQLLILLIILLFLQLRPNAIAFCVDIRFLRYVSHTFRHISCVFQWLLMEYGTNNKKPPSFATSTTSESKCSSTYESPSSSGLGHLVTVLLCWNTSLFLCQFPKSTWDMWQWKLEGQGKLTAFPGIHPPFRDCLQG